MKKQPSQPFIITEKEPGQPNTIGAVFDYFYERGYETLPKNVTIKTELFKNNLHNVTYMASWGIKRTNQSACRN